MSETNDTPRLDRAEDRMEDQERRLENDQSPRSLGGGGGQVARPRPRDTEPKPAVETGNDLDYQAGGGA